MTETVSLTAAVIAAYVASNKLSPAELPAVIFSVHAALTQLGAPAAEAVEVASDVKTKAEIRKSITPDALISFLDGKPYKTLKRHVAGQGLTMADYRARFGLSDDYPSTARNYSARRSEMAKALGLGQVRREMASPAPAPEPAPEPATPAPSAKKPRGRKSAS